MDGHAPSSDRFFSGVPQKSAERHAPKLERVTPDAPYSVERSGEYATESERRDADLLADLHGAIDGLDRQEVFQAKYDKGLMERFEAYHDQYVAANIAIEARLSRLGVSVSEWEVCKQYPHRIGLANRFHEGFGQDADRPFASLSAEFQRLKTKLDEERARYEATCVRLNILKKVSTRAKQGRPTKAEAMEGDPIRLEVRDELAKIAQGLVLAEEERAPEQTPIEAGQVHRAVIEQIRRIRLPGQFTPESPIDHERLLTIKSLVRLIEKRLDLVRVRLQNALDDTAFKAKLSENVGRTEEVARYRAELRRLLVEAAPLYLVDRGTSSPVALDFRTEYHLLHQWQFMHEEWIKRNQRQGLMITETQRANLDRGRAEVLRALQSAYPYNKALSGAPLTVYVNQE